jgi:hypothetical protein
VAPATGPEGARRENDLEKLFRQSRGDRGGSIDALPVPKGPDALLKLGTESQLEDGIDQSTTKAPTAIMESTAFATSSAGQGMTLTEGEGGGGPG